ncbi:MAG: haloacid dehalogenase-like hydrolase, partial [Candidatus Accumulibacter sp.]|nr:haloacid dehalogenase-like hydrolase [Accumulibacter sp.]
MKTIRFPILTAAVAAFVAFSACNAAPTASPQAAVQATRASQVRLIEGNWDTFNRSRLEDMIATHGKFSPNYNPAKPPYVVFDWDNTTIFLDIEEATLIYQLENLRFGATPEQMDKAIRMNIPAKDFTEGFRNVAGQALNIDKVAKDISRSYTWLYQNYVGLNGDKSLQEVAKAPQYKDFITKVRFLYEAIGDTFDHATSYPWITYLFTGMTESEVRALAAETMVWQQGQPVEAVKWTSPAELPGDAGVVAISWKNGLRIVPEMQDLYAKLRAAGFDLYVCSASYIDVIREVSSNPAFGYNNPADRAYAMELERDANGVIQSKFREGYAQTQGPGKTETIKRFLVSRYGYDPIFIAGDSEGDQNMMKDFDDTKLVLIINR